MSKRFFTSDLHFNSECLVSNHIRPFKSVQKMNEALIRNINQRCKEDDILISVGDVCQYGNDRNWKAEKTNPKEFTDRINATFFNIEGNHDRNNKVKSVCNSLRTTLGRKYISVSVSHYPSNHPKSKGSFRKGDVHIHGHIHNSVDKDGNIIKPNVFTIDTENKVLNVNVNCELWNYNPISEDELISVIDRFMREETRNRKTLGKKSV